MNFYAVFWPRNFANEFDILAFQSRKARERFLEAVGDEYGGQNATAESITRKEAQKRLSPSWLSPGVLDCTGGVNVYLRGDWDKDKIQDCNLELSKLQETDEAGVFVHGDWVEGLSDPVGL